jgi:hypothetical protein
MQRFYQDHLARILLGHQERDGSWWDYPFYNYHQQYGTAFALMSLQHCRNQTRPVVGPAEPVGTGVGSRAHATARPPG